MSITQRQIVWCVSMSFLIAVIVGASFIAVFPISNWSELWYRHFMNIPFVIFIPAFSITTGVLLGAFSGIIFRRQLIDIDHSLHQLEEGRQTDANGKPSITEIQTIATRIEKLGKQMSEQAKISQRLATEKVEDQESRTQKIIEEERNRLARELHDSVSQQLFAASMMMSAINETKQQPENEREAKQLKMVEEMINQSQLEMRALLLHLRPVALRNKSLKAGIEELLIELSQKVVMDIQWKLESFPLDKGVEDHLFRILQESISNTLRHAKASKLDVLLINRDDLVILRIVDDGVGFEVDEATKAGSYGMQNMHERALEVGATLKIISVKNNGTRLEVKVPVRRNGEVEND